MARKLYFITTTLLCIVLCVHSYGQSPTVIKNIDTITVDPNSSSSPGKGVSLNGYFYFPATDFNGNEPWRTNGTAAGTTLLRDLFSLFDRDDANPRLFIPMGDSLYFFSGRGYHLYKYTAYNSITREIQGQDAGYTPPEAVTMGNYIFFAGEAYFGDGVELVRYDIANNNFSIFDVNSGTGSSYPHNLTVKGDTLFFAASDGINGTELWMYDNNIQNIAMVQDIKPGADSSNPTDLIVYNDKLFFTADDGTYGKELWVSDGSSFGTQLYTDINTNSSGADGSNPSHKTIFNDQLFFSADDGTYGNELWYIDDINSSGVANPVAEINGSGDANPGITGMKQAGSYLYFSADDGFGYSLWKIDASLNLTQVLNANFSSVPDPRDFYNLGSTLIFSAYDYNTSNWQIWQAGTSAASVIQAVQPAGFSDTLHISGVHSGKVYFGANNGVKGTELWATDGTSVGTMLVKDINLGQAISSNPAWFEPVGGYMYFPARTSDTTNWSLFRTDATSSGTTEIMQGTSSGSFAVSFAHGAALDSLLIFAASTDTTGTELWKSNVNTTGTSKIKSIRPGLAGGDPNQFTKVGNVVFFVADDGTTGQELWKTDGTAAGTTLVLDINPGSAGSSIENMVVANNKLFFKADDGAHGKEVWVSDGSPSGTFMLQDINGSSTGTDLTNLFPIGNLIYFGANDGTHGKEVWTSNGTSAGTTMLKDIVAGSGSSNPDWFAQLGSYVYFGADSGGVNGLWRTDGTPGNTGLFYNVTFCFELQKVGNRIVFIALPQGSTNGFHIWSTDGTVAGTTEIENFLPGTVGYFFIENFPVYNGHVFYWIDDQISGQELWSTDGTAAGTIMYDIAPGPHSSYPREARGLNPLIFSADDGSIIGREPYSLNVPNPLPIKGLTFSAVRDGNTGLLNWKTFSETNNYGFQVQHSMNGTTWDSIGFVYARGTAGGGAGYNFTDAHPQSGKNYYRLMQVDLGGAFSYSDTRTVDFPITESTKAYPNPASDVLNINTTHTFINGELVVRNMSGQVVLQQPITGNSVISIPIRSLASGIYTAEIRDATYSNKLIFNKQ